MVAGKSNWEKMGFADAYGDSMRVNKQKNSKKEKNLDPS